MRRYQATALLALTGLMLSPLVLPPTAAQEASANIRLAVSRGFAEVLNSSSGRWERVKGPLVAAEGTAVRTAHNSELIATLTDGSTVTVGQSSSVAFARLRLVGNHGEIGVRMLGQCAASISPQGLQSYVVNIDMPVARATLNRDYATAHAVREDLAGSVATVQFQTPTARAVRMAVTQGAAVLTPLFNIQGSVGSLDAAHGTFTVLDSQTGRLHRVVVGSNTLLAHSRVPGPAAESPAQIISQLTPNAAVVVYGNPAAAEGPAAGADVTADLIFPAGSDYLSGERFVTRATGVAAIAAAGAGSGITAGTTGSVTAGSTTTSVMAGSQLAATVARSVSPTMGGGAAGVAGGATLPIAAGVAVAAAATVIISNNNNHSSSSSSNTGSVIVNVTLPSSSNNNSNINVHVSRAVHRQVASRVAAEPGPALAPLGASVMATATFRGPMLAATAGDRPALVGALPLSRRLQLHLAASMGQSETDAAALDVDLGLDYRLDDTHALGFGVERSTWYMADPLGNSATWSTTTPQIRYTVRF